MFFKIEKKISNRMLSSCCLSLSLLPLAIAVVVIVVDVFSVEVLAAQPSQSHALPTAHVHLSRFSTTIYHLNVSGYQHYNHPTTNEFRSIHVFSK